MNMITRGRIIPEGGEWRSPDSLWLDLEEEEDGEVFLVNVVMDNGGYGIKSALSSGPTVGKQ